MVSQRQVGVTSASYRRCARANPNA